MTEESTAIVHQQSEVSMVKAPEAMSVAEIVGQTRKIQEVMEAVMHEGHHFGTIEGCGPKPSLLKPGAEKLSLTFRLRPKFKILRNDLPNFHREYEIVCSLYNQNGGFEGEGVGACSTMETRYRYRKGELICPECGVIGAVIKGKEEYGGGWLCFKKRGGCGAKWQDEDPIITEQVVGKIEHPDPADYYNTALKIGKKRAFVDAVLTATAASDIFSQDLEDIARIEGNVRMASDELLKTLSEFAKISEGYGDISEYIRGQLDGDALTEIKAQTILRRAKTALDKAKAEEESAKKEAAKKKTTRKKKEEDEKLNAGETPHGDKVEGPTARDIPGFN